MESSENLEKKWIKIYPIYIDKALKYSEGRKVSLAHAAENPTAKDIYTVCSQFLGLNCKLENKSHPKDWMKRGRVIVQLKKADGKPVLADYPKKFALLKSIGETILKHKEKPVEQVETQEKKKKRRKK